MASIEKTSRDHLRKMVRGAGRQTARDKGVKKSKLALSKETIVQLQEQMRLYGKTIQKIPVDLIHLDENIRERYDQSKLKHLAQSLQHEGLIQFPTLCLRADAQKPTKLICRNGHRRILAAKQLGWQQIECVIIPFDSVRDELYHTINANLREDVFYLDLAFAYQEAYTMGESDQAVADRVGLNPRTVGWYRRLTKMSQSCQNLCRSHPDLFHATWAIKLARQGELPEPKLLEAMMQKMLANHTKAESDSAPKKVDRSQRLAAQTRLKTWVNDRQNQSHHQFAQELLTGLSEAGYLSPKLVKRIQQKLFAEGKTKVDFVEKGLRQRQGHKPASRRAKA
ncbi:MAG: ParB/RepB/Spo0J family partition protein [Oligoflexus sp.]